MDRSRNLWDLVEAARQHRDVNTAKTPSVPRGLSVSEEEQRTRLSLLSTAHTLNAAVADAVTRASVHVRAVLAALDAATPSSTTHLQNSLLLSDAELLSVSSSLKTFAETLAKVKLSTKDRRRRKHHVTAKEAVQEAEEMTGIVSAAAAAAAHGDQFLSHLGQVVATQEQRVAAKRLQVALAKEELALYKTEMFLYGHCGVLTCSDAVAAQLAQHRPPSPETAHTATTSSVSGPAHEQLRSRIPERGTRSGFSTTFRVVDGMMQRAAQTVKAAGTHADSALHVALTGSQAAARQLLNAGTTSVDGIVMMTAGGRRSSQSTSGPADPLGAGAAGSIGLAALPLPLASSTEVFSHEEESRLQEQNQALLQVQHEATAQDAKAVEASIRELSQLTSLMNEQVVQQAEQFSILVKNTEAAHTNVQKAVVEVEKPLQAFWNPTRQLIALLWACTMLVLVVNGLFR